MHDVQICPDREPCQSMPGPRPSSESNIPFNGRLGILRVPFSQCKDLQCDKKLSILHANFLDGIGIYSLRAFERTYFQVKWRSIAELTLANDIGDERHCVFGCPHFQGLRQQHGEIVQDPHDAMRSFMWHKDQKSVCALVLAFVNEAQTARQVRPHMPLPAG